MSHVKLTFRLSFMLTIVLLLGVSFIIWSNTGREDDYTEKNKKNYYLPSRAYPADYQECTNWWLEMRPNAALGYLASLKAGREDCWWRSNAKRYSFLLHCPQNGEVKKQTYCGDFPCPGGPLYECNITYQNPNYVTPKTYEECLVKKWPENYIQITKEYPKGITYCELEFPQK